MTKPTEWDPGTLDDVLEHVDVRNKDNAVDLVLSVTEGRSIVPQSEVFNKRVATDDTSKYKVLQPLDIAWNPYLLWTGAIGQWLGDRAGVTSPVYPVFRVREGQDARFWGMALEGGVLTPYFDSRAIGSIVRRRRTTMEVFKEAPTFIPPLPIQKRIVEVIGAVDDQITALDAEAETAMRVRGGLLDEFTGAASSDTKPLGELCPVIGSGPSWAAKDESSVPSEGAWTVLKITNTRPDGSIDLSELAYVVGLPARTKVIGPTSLVMIRTNGNRKRIGNVYLPPEEVHGAAVSAFQFTLDAVDVETRDYLYLVLRSPRIQHQMSDAASGSTGLGNLAVRWLKTLEIPWPDAEMRELQVESVQAIDATVAAIRAEADHLRSVRAGLLSGLLDRTVDIKSAELGV